MLLHFRSTCKAQGCTDQKAKQLTLHSKAPSGWMQACVWLSARLAKKSVQHMQGHAASTISAAALVLAAFVMLLLSRQIGLRMPELITQNH